MTDLQIPIPHYPPFKLRSSLIDKDPVIWVHLLEAYIHLFEALVDSITLNVKSQQQLQTFLRVYLAETAGEKSQIFSLGHINPDIKRNTANLRAMVFCYIKYASIAKANLTAETVWNFICVYVENNASTVRGLVDGTYKSRGNDNKKSGRISSIPFLHKHLQQRIVGGKFGTHDLKILASLLGQHVQSRVTKYNISGSGPVSRNVTKSNSTGFAETFATAEWIEILEKVYAKGKGAHADVAKNAMVITLLSIPASKTSKLVVELGVTDSASLGLYPLFGGVLISDTYREMVPNLEERLPFLRETEVDDEFVTPESLSVLSELFPEMSDQRARELLRENHGDVEHVTNMLLENPQLGESQDTPTKRHPQKEVSRSVYDNDKISRLDFSETKVFYGKKERTEEDDSEAKKRTLENALRLLNNDDDEPDDTYDDQEKTTGEDKPFESKSVTEVSANERHLYFVWRTEGPEVFERPSRKSLLREDIKMKTGWSDERIETWFRMVSQSTRRMRSMEEDFLRNMPTNMTRAQKRAVEKETKEKKENGKETKGKGTKGTGGPDKNEAARKEKNKSSRANHSRKAGHSKKTRGELAGMQ